MISSVIRQKVESQNGGYKKRSAPVYRKSNISYPLIRTRTCAYHGVGNVGFRKIGHAFLVTTALKFTQNSLYDLTKCKESFIKWSLV